jgi:hypothetical protein
MTVFEIKVATEQSVWSYERGRNTRKLRNDEQLKEDALSGACGTHEEDDKCIQNICQKN